jgi:hypothetical protein
MWSRYCSRMSKRAVTVMLAFAVAAAAQNQQNVCCDFSANKKALWKTVLTVAPERSDDTCSFNDTDFAYTERDRIVVGFHGICFNRESSARTVLLQVDAASGRVIRQVRWASSKGNILPSGMEVWPTHDGMFLVKEGPDLKLFSADLIETKSRVLIKDSRDDHSWLVHVQPSLRRGFLKDWSRYDFCEDHWFSTDTLEDEVVEEVLRWVEGWTGLAASASNVYFNVLTSTQPNPMTYVRGVGQAKIHELCPECFALPEQLCQMA